MAFPITSRFCNAAYIENTNADAWRKGGGRFVTVLPRIREWRGGVFFRSGHVTLHAHPAAQALYLDRDPVGCRPK